MDDDLRRRIAHLEDLEAIRRLKHTYCALCDGPYDAPKLAALFTEDAVWDAGAGFGRYEGRAAIEGFFRGMTHTAPFCVHTAINDLIDVQGDVATARFRANIPVTPTIDGKVVQRWIFVEYEDAFRRVGGKWFFTLCRSHIYRVVESPTLAAPA